jgi:hypothetical protein
MSSQRRPFPGFDNLFWLTTPMADRPYQGRWVERESIVHPFREAVPRLSPQRLYADAILGRTAPLQIERSRGSKFPSPVTWVDISRLTVSSRVIEALRPFSGWSTFPVTFVDVPAADHVGLAVWGRSGPAFMDESRQVPKLHHVDLRGMFIDPETWDGSDIFEPSARWGPIVTDEVRRAMNRAKIHNLQFVRMSEYEYPMPIYELSPAPPVDLDWRRKYMLKLRSFSPFDAALIAEPIEASAPPELDPVFVQPGIRVEVVDDRSTVDALVLRARGGNRFEVRPVAYGHGSLRARS